MSDLNDRIAQYLATKKTLSQMHAANKAVAKKLQAAMHEHEKACYGVHLAVGDLHPNMLVTNVSRSRYFEVEQAHIAFSPARYYVKPICRNTGKPGKETYRGKVRLAGSLLPVTDDQDPVYVKWNRLRVLKNLEGQ